MVQAGIDIEIETTSIAPTDLSLTATLLRVAPALTTHWLAGIEEVALAWPAGTFAARLAWDDLPAVTLPDVPLPEDIRRSHPQRIWQYLAGRLCAEQALHLAGLPGLHRTGLQGLVGRAPGGAPIWPAGWCGSISHTAGRAVALAAPCTAVQALGVDVETLLDVTALPAVIRACLTPHERAALPADATQVCRTTTLIFAAKEAYFKAVHANVGRFIDFPEVEVRDIDWGIGCCRLAPVAMTRPAGDVALPAALPVLEGRFCLDYPRLSAWVAVW